MENTPAQVIVAYLIENGYFATPTNNATWPLYTGHMPEENKNLACAYDTQGFLDGTILRTGEVIEHYGFQIIIRSKDYDTGWIKGNEIALHLDGIKDQSVSIDSDDYVIENVMRTSAVIFIGADEKRRFEFSLNFRTDTKSKRKEYYNE